MACPRCGDDCHCDGARTTAVRSYLRASLNSQPQRKSRSVDVNLDDEPERSEEQFAASLEDEQFEASDVDEEQYAASVEDEQFGSATLQDVVAAEPRHVAAESNQREDANAKEDRALATNGAALGIERRSAEERALEQQAERWRDEVSSRIEGYKQKRSRKQLSGEFSMRFEWEQPTYSPRGAQAASAAAAAEPDWEEDEFERRTTEQVLVTPEPAAIAAMLDVADAIVDAAAARAAQLPDVDVATQQRMAPVAEPAPPRRSLRHTNIIEFPRLPFMPPPPDELAEPMMDKPRILDVPEEIVQELAEERTPLGDIALENQQDDSMRKPEFDVPPQVAPLPTRLAAALIDAAIVIAAAGVFMSVAQLVSPGLPRNRMSIAVVLATPGILWALYQYVLLVYGGGTAGMRVVRLEVRTFAGERCPQPRRRWRALAMMLSFMPLGLGLAWALADEDVLCWHDRITRTYLAQTGR
jgi:uncharacterized RDD family membrane protein YckC